MRQLASYEAKKEELQQLGATVIAASADSLENARKVAAEEGLTYPVAFGVTREESERFGAWWSEAHDGHIQPAEFLLSRGGNVFGAMYASGPIGRMVVEDVIRSVTSRERRRLAAG